MLFMRSIYERIIETRNLFYELFITTSGWVWPFREVAALFYVLNLLFDDIAGYWLDFRDWVIEVADKVETILTEADIWNILAVPIQWAEDAWNWVYDAWWNVTNIVWDWWGTVVPTVEGWIAIATQDLADLLVSWNSFWNITWPQWTGELDNLRASWNYFWTVAYPTLVSFTWLETWWGGRLTELRELIASSLRLFLPFRDDLVSLWGDIAEFFADPLQWTYNKLDEWFERFW